MCCNRPKKATLDVSNLNLYLAVQYLRWVWRGEVVGSEDRGKVAQSWTRAIKVYTGRPHKLSDGSADSGEAARIDYTRRGLACS